MSRLIRFVPAVSLLFPALLFPFSSGPDRRLTGAPGDQTCVVCHSGSPLNGAGGRVTLISSAGLTYTPGQQQTLTLTIDDSSARVWGFQITARLVSDLVNGQAGDFTPAPSQFVLCDNSAARTASGCPPSAAVQFLEHSSPSLTNAISLTWTAPLSDTGPVTIYAAVNAANGDRGTFGDHIYTAVLQLTPAVSTSRPSIRSGGVISAGAFQPGGVSPGTWLEVFGSNLSTTTRTWQGSDFQGNAAPTSLDGVSVTIGGVSAYVAYISPAQVNVQVPDDIPIGSGVPIVVTNGPDQSEPYILETAAVAPALFAPSSFVVNGKQYVAAMLSAADGTFFVAPVGAVEGVTTRPAAAGEVITLYGIGFGRVSPEVRAGTIATEAALLADTVTIFFGETSGKVLYAGVAPGSVGLYQFNVEVPPAAPGDLVLSVQLGGAVLPGPKFIAIQ